MDSKKYIKSIHNLGRLCSIIALGFMLGIPTVVCTVFGCWPEFTTVITAGGGLLAMMVPTAVAEVIAYAPILGSAGYITFITGNVMNLKLPVAVNAQQIAGVTANTEESDAISTMAISLSSIETVLIIAAGILLMIPLKPVFQLPAVSTATSYMVPALMGGLSLGVFSKGSGKTFMKNKLLVALAPLAMSIICCFIFGAGVSSYQGYMIIGGMVIAIVWAFILYKAKVVKMVNRDGSDAE